MSLFLLIVTIIVSMLVVRIGAVAFQMTGLEWSIAKFQALSCFSGTGFTTREAEMILSHPQRRRIASYLMVLGNAGLVTLIASLASSLGPSMVLLKFNLPFVPAFLPAMLLPWINLLIIIGALYVIYRVSTNSALVRTITQRIHRDLIKKEFIKPVSFEELLLAAGDYGITQIDICTKSPLLNKTLLESDLRKKDISVLIIERKGTAVPNPPAEMKILLDDRLVCFGKLASIREHMCATHPEPENR